MNQDQVEGNGLQFKGKVEEQWGKPTDDDVEMIAGMRDQRPGKIQERHGVNKDEAAKQLDVWRERNLSNFFERY